MQLDLSASIPRYCFPKSLQVLSNRTTILLRDLHSSIQQCLKWHPLWLVLYYVHHNTSYDEAVVESDKADDIPEFRKIYVEGCVCKGAKVAVKIAGLPGRPDTIHDVHFKACSFVADCDRMLTDCENVQFS